MATYKVGDPIWVENRPGDIGFVMRVFPYSGVVYARFVSYEKELVRLTFDKARHATKFGNIIPMDQEGLMCTEPENPNLPHWRRPKEEPLKGVKTEPLIGEAREAALRAQAVADAAFKEGQLHEFTGTEGDDWGVYDSYWHKVGDELCGTGLSTFVSAHDVTEEVRRRLAVDQ